MNYGKFRFEQSKKAQQAKKKQKQQQVKEIKLRPGTEENDYQTKLTNLRRFIPDGDKAKITIRFRGRELAHKELGMKQVERIEKDLEDVADALRSGALDLDRICKLIPNTEKQGVDVVVKGTPISFPDIDPVALVKYGKLPTLRTEKIRVDTILRSKKQSEEFLNLQLPEFDF